MTQLPPTPLADYDTIICAHIHGHRLIIVLVESFSLLWRANTMDPTPQTIYPCACKFHTKEHVCVFGHLNRRTARFCSKDEPYKMTSSIKLYFHTSKIQFLPLLLTKCSYSKKIEAGKLISIIYLVFIY